MTFEEALDELTQTVQAIERGGLPLADILVRYKVATACLARCRVQLDRVDAEIRVLVESSDGRLGSEPFAPSESRGPGE
jgi:exodeoxyribonuclease VII small subunit